MQFTGVVEANQSPKIYVWTHIVVLQTFYLPVPFKYSIHAKQAIATRERSGSLPTCRPHFMLVTSLS